MEHKKKNAEEKPNFLGELITGLAESFLGLKRAQQKTEQKPEVKEVVKTPVSVSNTYIIIHEEPKRKGLFKWLLGLFW